jgi:hypothetical protein
MNLSLLKQNGSSYDITDAVTQIEWSGSASQAARQLNFNYINAPFDDYDLPTVSTGDVVSFTPDDEEVFYGQIFGSEKSSAVGTITFTAYDMMKNLLESTGQYNFKNVTPEAVAQKVCSDAQIPIQSVYATGINIASMLCDDMSLYDVIMAAYTKAYRSTGDKYFPMIYQRGFGVYKSEWIVAGYTIADDDNLTSSSISETMDSIVNQVKIYDDKGNQIGEVKDDGSQSTYGVFQKTYEQEEGVNPESGAKALLSVTPSQTIKISAVGDPNCLSCYFVLVSDGATGLAGKYWISSDKHVWENNAHTMELELRFDSIMDEVESSKEDD